jgi:mono/diheme cytochrome c family protein
MGRLPKRSWLWVVVLSGLIGCSAGGAPADPVADGKRAFTLYCIGCHSLDASGPTALGPTMAGVMTRAEANPDGLTARDWLTREIVDPNAVIADGYTAGLMPTTYRTDLSPQQYQSLIAFLETLR